MILYWPSPLLSARSANSCGPLPLPRTSHFVCPLSKYPTAFSFPASSICSFSALAKYKVARASNKPAPSKSCYPTAPRSTRPQSRLRSLRSSQSHNTNSRRSFLRQRLMAAGWPTQLFPTSISFYLPPTRFAHKTVFHLKIFQS